MPAGEPPLLSVVVPIYNVGSYLAPCLDAVLGSTVTDLEVICVDDGSTDGSGEIAEAYAAEDPRVSVIHVTNGGLGRARNIGLDRATGRYLAFVDSDDGVPANAYELMVASLERSGSDLATGRVRRFNETRSHLSGLHKRAIPSGAQRTHISRMPSLVYDTTAWNKVFRRSFWDRHALRFPEGVLYEDIPVTIPAHVRAEAVDALTAVVYEWRERGDGSMSITQRRAELKNLQDRLTALEGVSTVLAEWDQVQVSREHDLKVLTLDMPLYLGVLDVADAEYRQYFAEHIQQYLAHVDDATMSKLDVWDRVAFELLRRGRVYEAVHLVQERNENRSEFSVKRRGLRNYAQLPYLRDRAVGVPDAAYDVSNSLPVEAVVEQLQIHGDSLVVIGYAFVEKVSLDHPWSTMRYLEFRSKESNHRVRRPMVPRRRPDITATFGLKHTGYNWSGFTSRIPLSALQPSDGDAFYDVQVKFVSPSARRGVALACVPSVSVTTGPIHIRRDDTYISAYGAGEQSLRVAVRRDPPQAHSVYFDRETETAEIAIRLPVPDENAELACRSSNAVSDEISVDLVPDVTRPLWATATLPISSFELLAAEEAQRTWRLTIESGRPDSQTSRGLVVAPDFADAEYQRTEDNRELAARVGGGGRLLLLDRRACCSVTGLRWVGGTFEVDLALSRSIAAQEDGPSFALYRFGREELEPSAVRRDGAHVTLQFEMFVPGADSSLAPGTWSLRVHNSAAFDRAMLPIEVDRARVHDGDLTVQNGAVHAQVFACSRHVRIRLRSGRESDAGGRNQELRRVRDYPRARTRPLTDAVLFQAWGGKQYSCSPRAIFEEMRRQGRDERLVWVRRNTSVDVPEGVSSVLLWSKEYYEVLATARRVISNDSMPAFYHKRPGSRYLQTWHGTPLKRIGFDIENINFGNPHYMEEFAVEVTKWDQLISPNAYSSEIFRRAFHYDGEILETGYPRNDVFYAPDVEQQRAAIRQRLGISPETRVFMWAPTWRDDQRDSQGRYSLPLPFDLSVWDTLLEKDDVILFRGHQLLQDTVGGMLNGSRVVRNVTQYPDIQDLYLASDVLITDYSSVMFDFANTRRPMIFYAWDLDIYRDKLRGFYVDFEEEVPGPLITDLDGLRGVLDDLPAATAASAHRYERFVEKYCSLEDGHASARVVEALFRDDSPLRY
jgi:CDP-glycerol glycerophosphotransferase